MPAPEEFGASLARVPRLLERALTALARSKFLADYLPLELFGDLQQVIAYLNVPEIHERVLDRVLPHITPDTTVVVGHSLGSVVAYEALFVKPEQVTTFITLGLPLGIHNVVFHKLTPAPRDPSDGQWPGKVTHWTNIAARGDIVASQKTLAPFFGPRVEDVLIDSGWDAHASTRYLNTRDAGAALARALG